MEKFNFIRTSDISVKEILLKEGFQLVSEDNGLYIFLNDITKSVSFENKSNIQYTNMLYV